MKNNKCLSFLTNFGLCVLCLAGLVLLSCNMLSCNMEEIEPPVLPTKPISPPSPPVKQQDLKPTPEPTPEPTPDPEIIPPVDPTPVAETMVQYQLASISKNGTELYSYKSEVNSDRLYKIVMYLTFSFDEHPFTLSILVFRNLVMDYRVDLTADLSLADASPMLHFLDANEEINYAEEREKNDQSLDSEEDEPLPVSNGLSIEELKKSGQNYKFLPPGIPYEWVLEKQERIRKSGNRFYGFLSQPNSHLMDFLAEDSQMVIPQELKFNIKGTEPEFDITLESGRTYSFKKASDHYFHITKPSPMLSLSGKFVDVNAKDNPWNQNIEIYEPRTNFLNLSLDDNVYFIIPTIQVIPKSEEIEFKVSFTGAYEYYKTHAFPDYIDPSLKYLPWIYASKIVIELGEKQTSLRFPFDIDSSQDAVFSIPTAAVKSKSLPDKATVLFLNSKGQKLLSKIVELSAGRRK